MSAGTASLVARFPRVQLAHLPTRIEPLRALTQHLGGPTLYIKRDDCTGLALGGNKTRKLEFLLAGRGRRYDRHRWRRAVQPRAPDRRGSSETRTRMRATAAPEHPAR